ncbi:MAG: segregation/condensation protein A [Lachnospiraceae bacterium]|nr:segregation/condensation protein A [Lachnospiraceae bacterium]
MEFRLEAFEGPLDLLLLLIEKNKVDICDIPIAEITDQYLEYVRAMQEENLDTLSDFLVMACTLLDIKARMLLPKEEESGGPEADPRTELVEQLVLYREYKMMANELKDHFGEAAGRQYREAVLPPDILKYRPAPDTAALLKNVTAEQLQEVLRLVLRRLDERKDPVRSEFGTIRKDPVRISDRLHHVIAWGRTRKKFSFQSLLMEQATRQEVVVTFLACLELIRVGQISVSQEETEGDIEMTWNEDCVTALSEEDIEQYD